ncbi:MAG: cytochrome c maturation protein CcmE [Paracoccaceae bacterium]|jgi:cytochrome c-type biogenesis protein CcmE
MKSLKKQRRIQIIVVLIAFLAVGTGLVAYAFRDGINFFRSPSDVLAQLPPQSEVFRIGGLVSDGSIVRGAGSEITFSVTDGNATVPVVFEGILPDLFAENQGMIGTGRYIDGVFVAEEILARHDETYMPKEVIDALKEQGTYQEADKS